MTDDIRHLRWLSIGHYVYGGLIAMGGCLGSIFILLGIIGMGGGLADQDGKQMPAEGGAVFIAVGTLIVIFACAIGLGIALAGRFLSQRRGYLYCLVIAGINCLNAPIGLALGVFTFIVLMRPSVRVLFGVEQPRTTLAK